MLPRNYLRARGEYSPICTGSLCQPELPPRTRRIRRGGIGTRGPLGTTSAHAENTTRATHPAKRGGNYLRARGEYSARCSTLIEVTELPPRTRRILLYDFPWDSTDGTTSAHAENTVPQKCNLWGPRNYLRARGEYEYVSTYSSLLSELPPRTRRIHINKITAGFVQGTTSAHAENTPCSTSWGSGMWNYLRARGEYRPPHSDGCEGRELPPRTRRILWC